MTFISKIFQGDYAEASITSFVPSRIAEAIAMIGLEKMISSRAPIDSKAETIEKLQNTAIIALDIIVFVNASLFGFLGSIFIL